jgi:hypothetical protein
MNQFNDFLARKLVLETEVDNAPRTIAYFDADSNRFPSFETSEGTNAFLTYHRALIAKFEHPNTIAQITSALKFNKAKSDDLTKCIELCDQDLRYYRTSFIELRKRLDTLRR